MSQPADFIWGNRDTFLAQEGAIAQAVFRRIELLREVHRRSSLLRGDRMAEERR